MDEVNSTNNIKENYDEMSKIIGQQVVKHIAPTALNFLWAKLRGRTIMVTGLSRSGKTSFSNYLMKGILLSEHETEKTIHQNIYGFKILETGEGGYKLNIKGLIDNPGHLGIENQAETIRKYSPDFLFIFLDCERIDESEKWFEEFCETIDQKFRENIGVAKRIRAIYCILNKYDKVNSNDEKYTAFKNKVKDIYEKVLKQSFLKISNENKIPEIFPCIAVKNARDSDYMKEIINNLASKI